MGKRTSDPLDAIELAAHAGAEVRCAEELTSLAKLEELERLQPGAFSACTFTIGDRHIVVYSPLASAGRTQSDVAHEIAHVLLGHEIKTIKKIGELTFFTCDPDEEQEANWLAGCLLLPRPALLKAARAGMDSQAIAEKVQRQRADGGFPATHDRGDAPARSTPPGALVAHLRQDCSLKRT